MWTKCDNFCFATDVSSELGDMKHALTQMPRHCTEFFFTIESRKHWLSFCSRLYLSYKFPSLEGKTNQLNVYGNFCKLSGKYFVNWKEVQLSKCKFSI